MTAQTTGSSSPAASGDRQRATIAAIRDHHERLGRTMADRALTVRRSIDRLSSPSERRSLVGFCVDEVLPHAAAEEETLYAAGAGLPDTRLLVDAMRREHVILRDLVGELDRGRTPAEIAGAATALDTMFQAHLEKENDLLLPALTDAGVDLGSLLEGMHDILGEPAAAGHHCTCGGHDDPGDPAATAELVDGELDVRPLAPAQRHEQIFATFAALAAGTAFVLVNDHDPKPLYHRFAAENPGEFTWEPVEAGPRVWRVRIGRS